jgi:Family of unknown function (DUF5677)
LEIDARRSPLEAPDRFADILSDSLPEVHTRLDECLTQLGLLVRNYFPAMEHNHAAATIANQAFNDFVDLCYDLLTCRGRPALRVSRALFEHLVNYVDVTTYPEAQQRYEAHHAVAAQVEADAAIGLNRLVGDEAKAARHTLRKLGHESKLQYEEALARYGSTFRARWAQSDLRDRANRHGLGHEYDFYRLASMVLHGSAGGARGTLSAAYFAPVHRTGPALQLCPPAYLIGLSYFRTFTEHAGALTPEGTTGRVIDALTDALALWPEYRRVLITLDDRTWPKKAPAGPMALMAISRHNRRRWYYWDPALDLVVRAEPPTPGALSPKQETQLERLIASLPPGDERADDWTTINLSGVQLTPKANARWLPADFILVPRGSGRILKEPIEVDLDKKEGTGNSE